jgi:hypothetical protein
VELAKKQETTSIPIMLLRVLNQATVALKSTSQKKRGYFFRFQQSFERDGARSQERANSKSQVNLPSMP